VKLGRLLTNRTEDVLSLALRPAAAAIVGGPKAQVSLSVGVVKPVKLSHLATSFAIFFHLFVKGSVNLHDAVRTVLTGSHRCQCSRHSIDMGQWVRNAGSQVVGLVKLGRLLTNRTEDVLSLALRPAAAAIVGGPKAQVSLSVGVVKPVKLSHLATSFAIFFHLFVKGSVNLHDTVHTILTGSHRCQWSRHSIDMGQWVWHAGGKRRWFCHEFVKPGEIDATATPTVSLGHGPGTSHNRRSRSSSQISTTGDPVENGVGSTVLLLAEGNDFTGGDVVSQVLLHHFVLAGVVSVNGLLVFAGVVAYWANEVGAVGQVLLDPLTIVLHGQVVLSLSRLVLGLGFETANFTGPSCGQTELRVQGSRQGSRWHLALRRRLLRRSLLLRCIDGRRRIQLIQQGGVGKLPFLAYSTGQGLLQNVVVGKKIRVHVLGAEQSSVPVLVNTVQLQILQLVVVKLAKSFGQDVLDLVVHLLVWLADDSCLWVDLGGVLGHLFHDQTQVFSHICLVGQTCLHRALN